MAIAKKKRKINISFVTNKNKHRTDRAEEQDLLLDDRWVRKTPPELLGEDYRAYRGRKVDLRRELVRAGFQHEALDPLTLDEMKRLLLQSRNEAE